jgi:4-hydroxy-2-oxoheptanedioate aldolase
MKNILKEKLEKGKPVIGTFVSLGHPDVTEMLAHAGFDWLLIDGEHSVIGLETMTLMMQSMNGSGCTPVVRLNGTTMGDDKTFTGYRRSRYSGALGKQPGTGGIRSESLQIPAGRAPCYGPRRAALTDPDYMKTANDEIMVIVQIETREAVKTSTIFWRSKASTPAISDPTTSVSVTEAVLRRGNDRILAAFDTVGEAAKKAGKPAGMFATSDNIHGRSKRIRLNTIDDADPFSREEQHSLWRRSDGSRIYSVRPSVRPGGLGKNVT